MLEVSNLSIDFRLSSGNQRALFDINFKLNQSERLGIVGESGAGKSVLGFSLINLLSYPGYISEGEVRFNNQVINRLNEQQIQKIRGNEIAMIFQDPMMTLNPVLNIETQMIETILAHQSISKKQAIEIAIDYLNKVHIPETKKRIKQYPFELSGGMRQRVVIAIALLNKPKLIIADEPTTALDVTIQAEVMELLLELCKKEKLSLILITHDLAVISQVTEKILVLYAGRVVEYGKTEELISNPQHPYTKGLINALPQMATMINGRKRLNQIIGSMPSLGHHFKGCSFLPRCPNKKDYCGASVPKLIQLNQHTKVACHLVKSQT